MFEVIKTIFLALLSGGIGAAVVKLIGDGVAWKRERKAVKEDKAEQKQEELKKQAVLHTEERLKAIEDKTDAQSEALKYILYDRIRYLALAYIADGEIDFDDRRILNEMHRSYHDGLNGNGDLDTLMAEVNRLPLKTRKGADQ